MTERKTYTAWVYRSEKWWAIEIAQVFGVRTQARRLADVKETARDALALFLDVDPNSFDVEQRLMDVDIMEQVKLFEDTRRKFEVAQFNMEHKRHEVIQQLSGAGISMRDIAELMDISHQRVSQILKQHPPLNPHT